MEIASSVATGAVNLFVLFPLRTAARLVTIFSVIFYALPTLLITLGIFLFFGIGVGFYGDRILEETDYVFRCVVYPVFRDFIFILIDFIRALYNPLICWYNAINWWAFGVWQEAIIPTVIDCGTTVPAQRLGDFLLALFNDLLLDYVFNLDFLTQELDFTNIRDTFILFWQSWLDLLSCGCSDLALFFRLQPVIVYNPLSRFKQVAEENMIDVPFPTSVVLFNPLWILGSNQFQDVQFWAFISNGFNAIFAIFHVLWRLLIQVITAQPIDPRPTFGRPIELLCDSLSGFVRSCENVAQLFTDNFIPFTFDFENFLCIIDTSACIILKSINLIIDILINIDQVVFYPSNPYWGTVVKDEVKQIINLYGPVSYRDYGIDPNIDPNFTRLRLSDCLCIFISRLICDPTNNSTACFDSGAQQILGTIDFDICCLTDILLGAVGDVIAFIFELSLRLNSVDILFDFLDDDLFTWLVKEFPVRLADCLFNLFGLIPVVGPCIKVVIVELVRAFACYSDFFIKLVIGIGTIPYYLINGGTNFVLEPQRARDEFLTFVDVLSANGTNTFMNCLCFILNGAFPIPYIPCVQCEPVGFVPPQNLTKRYEDFFGTRFSPNRRLIRYENKQLLNPKQYLDSIYANSHDFRDKVRRSNDAYLQQIMNPANNYGGVIAERLRSQYPKQVADPECPIPYQPAFGECTRPDCFDFCCAIRTTLQAANQLLRILAISIDSLIHETQGPAQTNYFVNGAFENDLVRLIELGLLPLQCVCNTLEFIFPIPNLDLCAVVRETGNLIAGILLVIINSIKSLALDNPNFTYFTEQMTLPNFRADINDLSDISLRIVQGGCDILRAVLPIPVLDVCCFIDRLFSLFVEIIRLLINTIVNLALINDGGDAYFATGGGFATEGEVVITTIFGTRGGCCNQGSGGLINCFCGVINAIFPFRQFPGAPVQGDNCPVVDLCCAINEVGFFLGDLSKFLLNLLVSFFQPWVNGIPTGFVEFWVCNDLPNTLQTSCIYNTTSNAFECMNVVCFEAQPGIVVCNPVVLPPGCGRLAPVLQSFKGILECPCVVLSFIDQLLSQALGSQWECFCGDSQTRPGIVKAASNLIIVILERIIEFIRLFVSDQYWKPSNWPCANGLGTCPDSVRSFATFILGRIIDELCEFVFSITCFVDAWFGTNQCFVTQRDLVFSIVRWPFEGIIRVIDILTGVVAAFVDGCEADPVSIGDANIGTPPPAYNPIRGGCIGPALTNLLSFVVDIFIADGELPNTVAGVSALPECGSIVVEQNFQIPAFPVDCSCYEGVKGDFLCPNPDPMAEFDISLRRCFPYQPGSNTTCLIPPGFPMVTSGAIESCLAPPQQIVAGERISGVVIALLRYITCLLNTSGASGIATATEGLTVFLSFVWQLTTKIFIFFGNLVDLVIALLSFNSSACGCWTTGETCQFGLLCYPPAMSGCNTGAPPKVLCTVLVIFEQVFRSLVSFFDIFTNPPVTPPTQVPLKKRDMDVPQSNNTIDEILYTLFAFDTHDCIEDPVSCVNREFHRQLEGNCTDSADMIQKLAILFADDPNSKYKSGTTCQNLVHMCAAHNDTWDDVPFALKTQYVECIVRRIQAERIKEYVPFFPGDAFYGHTWPLEILDTVHNVIEEFNDEQRRTTQKQWNKRLDETFIPGETKHERCARATNRFKFMRTDAYKRGWKNPELLPLFLRLDNRERYLRSGEFMHNAARAHRNIIRGDWSYPVWPAAKASVSSLFNIVSHLASTNIRSSATLAYDALRGIHYDTKRLLDVGIYASARRIYTGESNKVEKIYRKTTEEYDKMLNRFYTGPLYQWWNGTSDTLFYPQGGTPIRNPSVKEHIRTVWNDNLERHQKRHWGLTDGLYAIKDSIIRRWTPKWTAKKLQNWEQVDRVYLKAFSRFFPDDKRLHSREIKERFIFNANCRVADEILELTTNLVQTCAAQTLRNVPKLRNVDFLVEFAKRSPFHQHANVKYMQFPNETRFYPDDHQNEWHEVYGHQWPRIVYPPQPPKHRKKMTLKSVLAPPSNAPTNFNFIDWILCRIDDLLAMAGLSSASQWLADTIQDIQDFVANDNKDILSAPVGLAYWLEFPFTCRFDINLNCSVGVGIEQALASIGLVFLVLFVGIALFFPGILLPFSLIGGAGAIMIILASAYHYSPRCLFPTPGATWLPGSIPFTGLIPDRDGEPISIPILSTLKEGVTVPGLPLRAAFPLLPFCLADDLAAFLRKWITDCYDFLDTTALSFLRPSYIVNGAQCPTCPNRVDVFNCRDLGMADGLSNFLFALYSIWPGACDTTMNIVTSIVWVDLSYLTTTFDSFKMATPEELDRLTWCFWATSPSLLFVLAFISIGAVVSIQFIIIILDFIWSLGSFLVSPIFLCFQVGFDEEGTFLPDDDNDFDDDQPPPALQNRVGIFRRMNYWMNRMTISTRKKRN